MQITFSFDTTRPNDIQLISQMLSALELTPVVQAPVVVAEPTETVAETKKRGRKAKAQEEVEAAPEVDVNQIDLPLETVAEAAKDLTVDDVRGALQKFTADKGVPAGIELLKKFGAGRISELKAEDYAAFVEACA